MATRTLDLPPLYELVTLREGADAFAHACALAPEMGAGALVFVGRFDTAECAVVLEPDEPLGFARRALYAAVNAMADALAAQAPPERPLTLSWPDRILFDGALAGVVRLGWPQDCPEDTVPDWIVFGAVVRTATRGKDPEPGARPYLTTLEEQGFDILDSGALVESFSRHLMNEFHLWKEEGFKSVAKRYLDRIQLEPGAKLGLDPSGDLLVQRAPGRVDRRSLKEALTRSSIEPEEAEWF